MTQATVIASFRGNKSISTEDLLFLVRKSKEKLFRLREFLSWKEVRKNVKQTASSAGPSENIEIPDDVGMP